GLRLRNGIYKKKHRFARYDCLIERIVSVQGHDHLLPKATFFALFKLVVMVENFWYHLRKRMPLYLGPLIAAGIIFIDWNHTREWKRNGRVSVLDMHLLNKGPPDTLDCDKQQH
ncbi:hypothetical protein Tcan_00113, partial [Toxocara canis]